MPEFDVGDKWTFKAQNIGDRKAPYTFIHQAYKSEAGSGWMYGETAEPNARRAQYIWRFDYKRADYKEGFEFDPKQPTREGKRFSNFQPDDDILQLPLTVGKKYAIKWNWGDGTGYTEYKVHVEVFEKIKVEAGEFEAYRVKLEGWWTRTKATAGSTWTGSGQTGRTYWFAPAVKRTIKTETFERTGNGSPWNQFAGELIKWEPKAALMPALTATPAPTAAVAAPALAVPAAAAIPATQ